MQRVAVFVDAGYLFAQGSTALNGSKVGRVELSLSARSAIEELKAVAEVKAPSCSLLRIYWYDGALAGTQMTADQASVAELDDTKLRLGFINSAGQQKGVDSLIVTDLIELARQKAICDAVLLSGDEDVRVGVQIAQNYGVRVHLLGIEPARGSQSRQLRYEADTTTVWDHQTVGKFLTVRSKQPQTVVAVVDHATPKQAAMSVAAAAPAQLSADELVIEATVVAAVTGLGRADLDSLNDFWKTNRGLPPEFDRKLLAQVGTALQRSVSRDEIRLMRSRYRTIVLQKQQP